MSLIPIKTKISEHQNLLRKPSWIKIKWPVDTTRIQFIKNKIRKNGLNTVCEEASCPNLTECFNRNTATFMILGSICTRRCPFCKVNHGRPESLDVNEPEKLAQTIFDMKLSHVVITSVNRDDLHDGGAEHFANCINAIRTKNSNICIEILVPDFRKHADQALKTINTALPDIFNHNIENVPRLYRQIRPGANYYWSLKLLEKFKIYNPKLITKSGLMVGLGETNSEVYDVMHDLSCHGVTMLTIGQYLQPSRYHLPVKRYVSLQEFDDMKQKALDMGFKNVVCGPFVRSSYHADLQIKNIGIK